MCTFLGKKAGMEMVSREERKLMWDTNSDGGGVMWAVDGKVHWAKGFMTFDEFEKFLMALDCKYGLKELPMVLHYRITTTKSKRPAQTHPHKITTVKEEILKLRGTDDVVFCHNGSMNSFYDYNKKLSDTQNFSLEVLGKMRMVDSEFYKKKFYIDWIESLTQSEADNYNRFIFLDKNGDLFTAGDITEENGYIYANLNHRVFMDYTTSYYKDLEPTLLMKLNQFSCGMFSVKDILKVVHSSGHVLDVISKNKNADVYAIDCEGRVYKKLTHLDRYELMTDYLLESTNLDLVEFDFMFAEKQLIVEFDLEKLEATFEF